MTPSETAQQVLDDAHTIAVVGLSSDPRKYSHAVPAYLQSIGYRIIPVHLRAVTLLDEKVYRSVDQILEGIDIVAVYRPSEEAAAITRQAVEVGARAVWLQQEVADSAAQEIAESAGLTFLQDRCIGRSAAAARGWPSTRPFPS